jgi:glycosyltransferase involved in cell wall biosynthesis
LTQKFDITLGIDASNITSGGGLTHLISILRFLNPEKHNISKIVIWTSSLTIPKLPKRDYIIIKTNQLIQGSLIKRMFWQNFFLRKEIKAEKVQILFSPGGIIPLFSSIPTVTASQNMLPFEWPEMIRFKLCNWMFFKMFFLRFLQSISFRRASGVIFLTKFARDKICKVIGKKPRLNKIIPHGLETRFRFKPKRQYPITTYTFDKPLKLLYVSSLMPYKHQLLVVDAVNILRSRNVPLTVTFIGESWGWYAEEMKKKINLLDPRAEFLILQGAYSHDNLHQVYHDYDIFVFASSCENLPNILIEAMASGIPILSTDKDPMPEILGDAAIFFETNDLISLVENLQALIYDVKLRKALSRKSLERSKNYSWEKCVDETFRFIVSVADNKLLMNGVIF